MTGEGDCYEAAAKLLYVHRLCPGIVLVHGTVTGQGPIAGIRYGHAWIEIGDDVVLDPSNGRFVCARKADYYAVGEINEPVTRYAFVFAFPEPIRKRLRTSNLCEALNKQIRRRTRVAAIFPNPKSCLRLVSAILMEISEAWETSKAYLNPQLLK